MSGSKPQDAADWKRKRLLAEVFGDSMPETTADEREPGEERSAAERGDAWLKEQVPPHHGGH